MSKALCKKRYGSVMVGDVVDVEQYESYNNVGYHIKCDAKIKFLSEETFMEHFVPNNENTVLKDEK